LNDENFICQLRRKSIKLKCPVSCRAFSSLVRCGVAKRTGLKESGFVKDRDNSGD
jgi:hypothetical protein